MIGAGICYDLEAPRSDLVDASVQAVGLVDL